MARNFDGTNDNLLSANNALPGMDVDTKSFGHWAVRAGNAAANNVVMTGLSQDGSGNLRWAVSQFAPTTSGYRVRFTQAWTTAGVWLSTNDISIDRHHIAITYDRSSAVNNPVMWVDGVSVAVTTSTAPLVTVSTGDDTLKCGEDGAGSGDLASTIMNLVVTPGIWDAASVNRARWWGRPHGGLLVYHPLYTNKLSDEGSAAETLTATGTTVAAFATPVVRPGSAMAGMEIGW
jgi:hypothetical protein